MGYGHILFVEVKTSKGRLSLSQTDFQLTVESNGGVYLVWRSDSDAMDWCHREGIVKLHGEVVT